MKFMATLSLLAASALSPLAMSAVASELDPSLNEAPQGIIVRESADGQVQVFKATLGDNIVDNDVAAKQALESNLSPENLIQNVQDLGELDRVSSDESWISWWFSFGFGRRTGYSEGYRNGYRTGYGDGYYGYTYNRWGRSYDYYPSYQYEYNRYRYSYYYRPDHYGYRGHHGRPGRY